MASSSESPVQARRSRMWRWWLWLVPASPAALGLFYVCGEVLDLGVPAIMISGSIVCCPWFTLAVWRRGSQRADIESPALRWIRAIGAGFGGLAFGPVLAFIVVGILVPVALPAWLVFMLLMKL